MNIYDETLLTKEIYCASDRGGCVLFGNRYFQYMTRITSPGDGTMTVKIIDYDEWCRLRDNNRAFSWERTKDLGTLEGHFYLYDNDCAHGRKEDAIVEFSGTFFLYDFCDEYCPTLYVVKSDWNGKHTFKILKESAYQND